MQGLRDLEKWRKFSYLCAHCRCCSAADYHTLGEYMQICPSGTYFGFESYFSSGKMEVIRGLIEGLISKPSEKLLEIVYVCTLCGACEKNCEEFTLLGEDSGGLTHIFEDARAFLVESGWGPLEKHKEFASSIRVNHNPYLEPHEKRESWTEKSSLRKGSLVYFTGCTSSYRQKEVAKATVKALEAMEEKFVIMGSEEWCCGSPLLRTGQIDQITELAEHNVKALKEIGAKKVITSCAGCYRTLKSEYPKILGAQPDFEVVHSSQFFAGALDKNKLKLTKDVDATVTYHDPCHLGRHMGVYDEPRNLLKKIPDLKLVEMPRSRQNSWCCGAGGGVKSAFPDFATSTAVERLREAEAIGVKKIVSMCPFCKHNLTDAAKLLKNKFEVYDVVELLSKAIG
ncbi:MAG: CoB--CoM heterodisulfide reductase iron-sulfur subunit D [Candidatus Bathyarchaeota archaeon BA2]|nr:MAG: CoB--CoM heterodisulfide reductase iron-sulfur subunit D [Candidatus Bathyarchaeota archaeon BA2]